MTRLAILTPIVVARVVSEDVTGVSACMSPVHKDVHGGRGRAPTFVRPAEERFTWEDVVAGVRVAGEGVDGHGQQGAREDGGEKEGGAELEEA